MSKVDEIRADLNALDAMTEASAEWRELAGIVTATEHEREEIDRKLALAVANLDACEAREESRKVAASARAVEIAAKYGKPIATLRAVLKDLE